VSGNAQHRRADAVVQHGSLTHSTRPARHLSVFDAPAVDEATFRERVTGIDEHADVTRERTVRTLERALRAWADADVGEWTADELARARERAATKYASEEWVRRRPERR
jgi:lipoate-protein ligase A